MRDRLQRRLLVAATLVIASACATATATAAADAEALTLAWDAPPECPSRSRILADVARLLGGAVPMPKGGPVHAHASVEHGPPWSVSLTTRNGDRVGRRSLEAASCQDLADATAMILALMIDPDAVAAHAVTPEVERARPPASATIEAPPAAGPAEPPMKLLATVHGQASLGVLPGLDAGIGAGIGLAGRRWRLEVRGTYGLRDQVARASASPEARGEFDFLGGAVAGCINLGGDAIGFGPCAGAELGMVSAKGSGMSVELSARTTWLAVGGGGYATIALGRRLAIPLHVDVMTPLRRPQYVIREVEGTVFQPPAVGIRLVAGVQWSF